MSLARAAALCPQAVLLPADFDEYRRVSRLFKAAVARVAPLIEDRGIDEIFIDLSRGARRRARRRARAQGRGARGHGLSCSIGVAPNKLLAKIASELDKPDGLTVLDQGDLAPRIWPLPANRINGIGPKAGEKLAALGIRSIGELAAADPARLIERFGAQLRRLAARGRARPRRAPAGHRARAQVDQPRDHLRARPARRARPRGARRPSSPACARSSPRTCAARATAAAASASSCATTTSAP